MTEDITGMLAGFDDLARYFAAFISRHAEKHRATAALTAALVSRELTLGHICINLEELAGTVPLDGDGEALVPRLPELETWKKELRESGAAGGAEGSCPMVLDGERLYLQRYWNYECLIAEELRNRAGRGNPAADDKYLGLLFPSEEEAQQKDAALRALTKSLAVISGGPGTGKTTTVARILFLLLLDKPDASVALAAPTGKAAARMMEAISAACSFISETLTMNRRKMSAKEIAVIERILALEGVTLHRLLGARPDSPRYAHDRSNPLRRDIVIIDEASMIDAAMMAKLLQALPEECRCIMLGDRDQLASVEAGAVLSDICGSAMEGDGVLIENVSVLKRSWRFARRPGIGALSEAVNSGSDITSIKKLFEKHPPSEGIELLGLPVQSMLKERLRPLVTAAFSEYAGTENIGEALLALGKFRILSPLREGPYGVKNLNSLIEEILQEAGLIERDAPMYVNRPVMITKNDHQLGLFNGDVGMVKEDGDGSRRVFFLQPGTEGPRAVMPSLLPLHETVFAMTVHKSQGSEFDNVLFVLPERDVPVLTRELLYTGITRARNRVTLLCTEDILSLAVSRSVSRASGLAGRLL